MSHGEELMRPCPKCGEPVHPENTGFHVCTITSNLDLIARLQAIVEGGEPDKSGRGYLLNLLAESCIEIKRLQRDMSRLLATAKTGGSDMCITCAAHVLVITEDLEPEIARLRGALQMIADNTICPEAFPDEANGDRLAAKSAMLIAMGALEGRVGGGDELESRDG